jgi:hypothetical protein
MPADSHLFYNSFPFIPPHKGTFNDKKRPKELLRPFNFISQLKEKLFILHHKLLALLPA